MGCAPNPKRSEKIPKTNAEPSQSQIRVGGRNKEN